jgi:hypothetical protein
VIFDGDHAYDCATADTASARLLVSPVGIVGDDYETVWPDVARAVDEEGSSRSDSCTGSAVFGLTKQSDFGFAATQ